MSNPISYTSKSINSQHSHQSDVRQRTSKLATDTVLSLLTPAAKRKQEKTSVCVCAEEETTLFAETETQQIWHTERIPLKLL